MSGWIELPYDGRLRGYERDKLETAFLVYLDYVEGWKLDPLRSMRETMAVLQEQHGFGKSDLITYAQGAKIAYENNIKL